jgi:hypothetical protein
VLREIKAGCAKRIYEGGRIEGDKFLAARWDLAQRIDIYVGVCSMVQITGTQPASKRTIYKD